MKEEHNFNWRANSDSNVIDLVPILTWEFGELKPHILKLLRLGNTNLEMSILCRKTETTLSLTMNAKPLVVYCASLFPKSLEKEHYTGEMQKGCHPQQSNWDVQYLTCQQEF